MTGSTPRSVAILEDDAGRVGEMRICLGEVLPGVEVVVFEDAGKMIGWLGGNLAEVVLISLDHDLPLRDGEGRAVDCGTGRQVADYLAGLAPTCPVIVHSSNQYFAPGMFFALKDAGWPCCRIWPNDDLGWVRRDWGERVRRYVREGWIL
jgi:hypothetical protein